MKPILCLDFDGVLHSYSSGWQGADVVADPPVPGAILFLFDALQEFDVHIFSSRSHQPGGIEAMRDAIMRWTLEEFYHDDLEVTMLSKIKYPTEKPHAKVTLDDRAITFEGVWPTIDQLMNFQPWNKNERAK